MNCWKYKEEFYDWQEDAISFYWVTPLVSAVELGNDVTNHIIFEYITVKSLWFKKNVIMKTVIWLTKLESLKL